MGEEINQFVQVLVPKRLEVNGGEIGYEKGTVSVSLESGGEALRWKWICPCGLDFFCAVRGCLICREMRRARVDWAS